MIGISFQNVCLWNHFNRAPLSECRLSIFRIWIRQVLPVRTTVYRIENSRYLPSSNFKINIYEYIAKWWRCCSIQLDNNQRSEVSECEMLTSVRCCAIWSELRNEKDTCGYCIYVYRTSLFYCLAIVQPTNIVFVVCLTILRIVLS